MSETYVRPTIGGWLLPLFVGPWISSWAAVTLYTFALGPDPGWTRWAFWIAGIALGTLFAAVFVVVTALVDVALLALRVRTLPTGKRAWAVALLAPIAPLAACLVSKPWRHYRHGPWAIAAILIVPVIASSLGARIAFGQKTQAKRG